MQLEFKDKVDMKKLVKLNIRIVKLKSQGRLDEKRWKLESILKANLEISTAFKLGFSTLPSKKEQMNLFLQHVYDCAILCQDYYSALLNYMDVMGSELTNEEIKKYQKINEPLPYWDDKLRIEAI